MRYARQMAVTGFGDQGQERIRFASALVIGAGGLAAPVLQYLVGAGWGRLRLVDPDIVEESNLHRQIHYRSGDVGRSKVEASVCRMAELNGDTRIEPVRTRFDPASAADLMQDVDVVLDCADSFAASYVASDFCLERGIALISASVVGTGGYVGGFCAGAPGLRAVFPEPPERPGRCDTDGVLGPAVGVIGALQAQMAMALAVGGGSSPLGRLVTYEARDFGFGGFGFAGAIDPDPNPSFIAVGDIGPDDFVVDLRSLDESGPELPGAVRYRVEELGIGGLRPDSGRGRAVLACRTGVRSWRAAGRLSRVWSGDIRLLALGN